MTQSDSDRELLAIANLTGQASDAERAAFQRLLGTDAGFRALVEEIGVWLAPLNRLEPEAPPPPELLGEIMTLIETHEAARVTPLPPRPPRNLWKPGALIAAAVAIVSTSLHFAPGFSVPGIASGAPRHAGLVALMSDASAPAIVVIVYDPAAQRVIAQVSNAEIPASAVWQLWLIREGAPAPQSLGILNRSPGGAGLELDLQRALQPQNDTLAISLEPPGGSPAATPSGPVLFTGAVTRL